MDNPFYFQLRWVIYTLALLTLLVACPAPPKATGVTYRIAISEPVAVVRDMNHWTDWNAEQRRWLSELPRTLRTGDTFIMVDSELHADFVLRTFDSPSCQAHGAGRWLPSDPRSLYLNTACLGSKALLLTGATHELEHALDYRLHHASTPLTAGLRHICRHLGTRPDCHPTISGVAILNPALPGEFDSRGEPMGPNDPTPTPLDVQLLHPR